jgi:hypothetical protein
MHCGDCDRACSGDHTDTVSCTQGLCNSTCNLNWGNCNVPATPASDDGCETDLRSTVEHCGECDRSCSTVNADDTACSDSVCEPTCSGDYLDCDQPSAPTSDDGCETDPNDPNTCGTTCGDVRACDETHVETVSCTGGQCDSTCLDGWGNCTQPAAPDADDGCETNLSDPAACGSTCGSTTPCAQYEICVGGGCDVPCSGTGQTVLFVVDSVQGNGTPDGAGDVGALYLLETQLGFTVNVVEPADIDTTGIDLVVVSSTVLSTDVGNAFTGSFLPVVTWEQRLFVDLLMTEDGMDVAWSPGQSNPGMTVDVSHPTHPLGAGLWGETSVLVADGDIGWGVPAPDATVVAREPTTGNAAVFAYDTGDVLVDGGTAVPARRVGLFFRDLALAAAATTDDGQRLAMAAFCWAAGL